MSGKASPARAPIPVGAEFLSDAAERTGYKPEQIAKIIAWHGAEVRRWGNGRRRARPWALRADVDAAVAAWLDTETVQAAAQRRGIPPTTLRDWLAAAGHKRPARHQHWRLPSATIDAVVAERRGRRAA